MKKIAKLSRLKNKHGAVGLMVTLLVPVFIGVAALSVDVYKNYVILPNELQNAADAGALAGAAQLYTREGEINTGANQVARIVAWQNLTTRVPQTEGEQNRLPPEVDPDLNPNDPNYNEGSTTDPTANTADVQRGHWAFGPPVQSNLARGFYENASTATVDLGGVTSAVLDANDGFINAVRVVARRENTPIVTFFARIFGVTDTQISREAVAYIGFAGRLNPEDVDQPIAICRESITVGEGEEQEYTDCNIGRMLNSGGNDATHNTGGWTDFVQDDEPDDPGNQCPQSGADNNDVRDLVCGEGNPNPLFFGDEMAATGGTVNSTFRGSGNARDGLADCWDDHTILANLADPVSSEIAGCDNTTLADLIDLIVAEHPGTPPETIAALIEERPELFRKTWGMTLPVITCPGNNIGNCERLVGAVEVNVAWINATANSTQYDGDPGVPMALFDQDCNHIWDEALMLDEHQDRDIREARWMSFINALNLQNVDGLEAEYALKSIYFLPDCDPHEPIGVSGGENFGILARIPVLVCPDEASHVGNPRGCFRGPASN